LVENVHEEEKIKEQEIVKPLVDNHKNKLRRDLDKVNAEFEKK